MGKTSQRFNKKKSVRFTLIPSFDQNGKPTTLYRPVQQKKSSLSKSAQQKIIKQISDDVYDQIQINGKKLCQSQIPAFVLDQIRGRKDLIFNQKPENQENLEEGDLYQMIDGEDQDEERQYVEEEMVIGEDEGEWEEDSEGDEEFQEVSSDEEHEHQNTKDFVLKEEDFPQLSKFNYDGKQYQLTAEQIKLLDVILPDNYQNYKIKGLNFQKFDEHGLNLSNKAQYDEFLSTGKQGIVDQFTYVPEKPVPIYDNDLNPSQITGQLRQIEDALNYEGQQQPWQELEDDFFAKLVRSQIETNKKEKRYKKKTVSSNLKPQPIGTNSVKLPKILQQSKKQNMFSKYNQLDDEKLQEQISDQMLQRALHDFQTNKQPISSFPQPVVQQQAEVQISTRSNMSMNFSQIQTRQQYFGRDGQLDWRCLTKKQKKQYMKTKIIRDFYDQVREREIQDKLKGKKNVTQDQLHLKAMVRHIKFQDDHVMKRALEEDAKQIVDMDQPSDYQSSSQDQDIVQYRQRTSVISSGLNEVCQPTKKRKPKDSKDSQSSQLNDISMSLSKLKSAHEKRNRKQTPQQRKARKQKMKQVKKERKQLKKQFAEKFSEQRRKQIKMSKPNDPLHKVSYVKII